MYTYTTRKHIICLVDQLLCNRLRIHLNEKDNRNHNKCASFSFLIVSLAETTETIFAYIFFCFVDQLEICFLFLLYRKQRKKLCIQSSVSIFNVLLRIKNKTLYYAEYGEKIMNKFESDFNLILSLFRFFDKA